MNNTQTAQMNASTQFCPNLECTARGQVGQGNLVIHSRQRLRYRCTMCGKTFSARQSTMVAGLRKPRARKEGFAFSRASYYNPLYLLGGKNTIVTLDIYLFYL